MQSQKSKYGWLVLLIPVLVLLYVIAGGSIGISLDFGEDSLSVGAGDRDWMIPYVQIASLELQSLPEPGMALDATQKRTLCCGDFENDNWGRYTLCADPRISSCLVITLQSGEIFVLNYENADSTAQLHQMFTELLQSKGCLSE